MKTRTPRFVPGSLFAIALAAGMMTTTSSSATGTPAINVRSAIAPGEEPADKDKGKESKAAKNKLKPLTFHRSNVAKIYMDMGKHHIHVVAGKNDDKDLDFFVFGLDGTLVQNYRIKAGEQRKIAGLAKGTYVYRVFIGDEEEVSGNLVIK